MNINIQYNQNTRPYSNVNINSPVSRITACNTPSSQQGKSSYFASAGSREDDATAEEDRITVSITAHMTADSNEVNTVHNFGVTVEVEDIIWATEAPVKVLSPVKVPEMVSS